MGELLLRKAIAIRDRVAKIRNALPSDPSEVLRDDRLEAYISFNVFLLAQDVVDLAVHLVAARGLAVPASQREAFEALHGAGILARATADAMAALASLRNRIAHQYGDLDPIRLAREAPAGLAAVEGYLDELATLVADASASD
jgi:uncharacterized protein YutE (UPF0331/DUF86 family)